MEPDRRNDYEAAIRFSVIRDRGAFRCKHQADDHRTGIRDQ